MDSWERDEGCTNWNSQTVLFPYFDEVEDILKVIYPGNDTQGLVDAIFQASNAAGYPYNPSYTIFYGLNSRFNQLIIFSCMRGYIIHSTKENNLYLKQILPDIPSWEVSTLKLWHNSSYEQLLNDFPINLYQLHTLILKRLKNLSFYQYRQLFKHFKSLETLSMTDFHTPKVDWLDDNNWKNLIEIDLPNLRHLDVCLSVIYHKQICDDDKDNIIYSFTSRYGHPTHRLYTGSLLKKDPILEIRLTIDQVFPMR